MDKFKHPVFQEILREAERIAALQDNKKVDQIRALIYEFGADGLITLSVDSYDSFLERIKQI